MEKMQSNDCKIRRIISHRKLSLDEVISYECHVKGITFDESSQVTGRGTFIGLTERLADIRKLGVNQLILMPIYDFDEELDLVFGAPPDFSHKTQNIRKNYWGFAPGNYFHLKRNYIDKSDEEFVNFMNKAHGYGMEVIMMIHFPSDVNTEMMIEALKFWYSDYVVDGFFLNVNPYYLKMISDCSFLNDAKLYTYNLDESINYTNPERIAVYDYDYRNVLRKMLRGDEGALKAYVDYIRYDGTIKRIVSVCSHNGFTLYDLYSYSRRHNELNGENNRDGEEFNYGDNCGVEGDTSDAKVNALRLKLMKNALTMLLLGNGIPMILAGDEEANSQKGNNNAYCQDNNISWIQYGHEFAEDIKCTISECIKIRNNSGFNNSQYRFTENKVNSDSIPCLSIHGDLAWDCRLENHNKHCGIMYAGDSHYLYVAVNFDKYAHKISIPHLPKDYKWSIIARTDSDQGIIDCINESEIVLEGQSIRIYEGIK